MHGEEHRGHAEQRERGEKKRGREVVGTIDEGASSTNAFGSVNPDGAPGAQPFAESSPATVATTAAGVVVVSTPNQEDTRERLKQAQREAKHTRITRCPRSIEPKKLRTTLTRELENFISLSGFSVESLGKKHVMNNNCVNLKPRYGIAYFKTRF